MKAADAAHLADAIALGCHFFLTNDKQLRNRSAEVEERWPTQIRRPSEFLVHAVKNGAPWTARAPWPWESLQRIRESRVTDCGPG